MADHLSIEECKAIQRKHGLGEVHVVSIGDNGFAIAHTDAERQELERLTDCELHRWLCDLDAPPHDNGVYLVAPHLPDPVSEPYGADPWDFYPRSLWVPVNGETTNE